MLLSISTSYVEADDAFPDFNKAVQNAGVPPTASCNSASEPNDDPARRWIQAGFKNAVVESWSLDLPSESKFTHELEITTVLFRGANWTKADVQSRFKRLSGVYSQCGIKVQKVNFVESDAPNGWIDVDGITRKDGDIESQITKSLPVSERPIFFYVRSSKDVQSAYAQPEYWVSSSSPALNTVWVTSESKSREKNGLYNSSYSTEAHELGHVLLDSGHVKDESENFLANSFDKLNAKITQEQCNTMKKNKLVRPL